MKNNIDNIAADLGIDSESLHEAIENNKIISKRKYVVLGKSEVVTLSGFRSLLPLYREAINKINTDENERMFNQIAAREGVNEVEAFINRMNTDAVYRTEILRKYKIV